MAEGTLIKDVAQQLNFRCPIPNCQAELIGYTVGQQVDSPCGSSERTRKELQQRPDISRLPSLIAHPLQDYYDELNPVIALWNICDTIELLLRFSVALGTVDIAVREGKLPKKLLDDLRPRIEMPTFGKWRGMAQAVVNHISVKTSTVPELPSFMNNVIIPLLDGITTLRTAENSLIMLRNQLAHGGSVTRSVAQRLLECWSPRFEEAISHAVWFADIKLVAVARNRFVILKGIERGINTSIEQKEDLTPINIEQFRDEQVLAVRRDRILPLCPLIIYGLPRNPDPDGMEATRETPQIYVRRGEVALYFTPIGSDEVCQSVTNGAALENFLTFFHLQESDSESQSKGIEVRGFEDDIRRDANNLIGRSEEVNELKNRIIQMQEGLIWVTGPPGIGKSYLVARVASELIDEPPARSLILIYRFKSGDDRCTRGRFFQFAIERIERWILKTFGVSEGGHKKHQAPFDILRALLNSVTTGRVLIMLDGLDELAERDSSFATEVILRLQLSNILWICAGRPEHGLQEVFSSANLPSFFAHKVLDMNPDDIRSMLLEKIGFLRKKLLINDKDQDGAVINPFIEKVAKYAHGLPIYVTYVIGDILNNRFRALDAGERLPESLERYHEELLKRCDIGTLQQILTPLAALVAVSQEPLRRETIAAILLRANILPNEDDFHGLIHQGLLATASMLKRSSTPDGKEGFTLFHHSLRQHMETSVTIRGALSTIRQHLCHFALQPGTPDDAGAPYLCKWGVTHLMENRKIKDALFLLTDFSYLMNRLQVVPGPAGVLGVGGDWRLLESNVELMGDSLTWRDFWRMEQHLLAMVDENWPSFKILLQLAWDFSKENCITHSCRKWIASSQDIDWPWLRLANPYIPQSVTKTACIFTLLVSENGPWINSCAVNAHGDIAISGGGTPNEPDLDNSVRVWNLRSRECIHTLAGHAKPVIAVDVNADGALAVSGDLAGQIFLWDTTAGRCTEKFENHGPVIALSMGQMGDYFVSCGNDGEVCICVKSSSRWQRKIAFVSKTPVASMAFHEGSNRVALGDAFGRVMLVDLSTGNYLTALEVGNQRLDALSFSPNGKLIACGDREGKICVWDLEKPQNIKKEHLGPDSISSIVFLDDKSFAVATKPGPNREDNKDTSIHIFGVLDKTIDKSLYGHCDSIFALAAIPNRKQLLSCGADASMKVWDLTLSSDEVTRPSPWGFVNHINRSNSPHQYLIAMDNGAIGLWDITLHSLTKAYHFHDFVAWAAAVTPDGTFLISCSEDRTIFIHTMEGSDRVAAFTDHEDPVNTVTLSVDGNYAISGSGNGKQAVDCNVHIYDITNRSLKYVLKGATQQIEQVVASPDGRMVLASSWDGLIHAWSIRTGELLKTIANPGRSLRALAISPTGLICCSGNAAGIIRVWDLQGDLCLAEFSGHEYDIRRADISADGRMLATVSDDCRLRIWDLITMNLVASISFSAWATAVKFIGAEYRCIVGLGDGQVTVVDAINFPEPAMPVVTAVRIWHHRGSKSGEGPFVGFWDEHLTALCARCGSRFVAESSVIDCILDIFRNARIAHSPCLELPREAWDESKLISCCKRCGAPVQFNPFFVNGRHNNSKI